MWPLADKNVLEIARTEALDIFHHHKPSPLPDGAVGKIEAILEEADKELNGL